jgi:hypothetical protein
MMIADGVSGCLANESNEVSLSLIARHSKKSSNGDFSPVAELELAYGDGMCMAFHGWREGDFGENPPALVPARKRKAKAPSKTRTRKKRARS